MAHTSGCQFALIKRMLAFVPRLDILNAAILCIGVLLELTALPQNIIL